VSDLNKKNKKQHRNRKSWILRICAAGDGAGYWLSWMDIQPPTWGDAPIRGPSDQGTRDAGRAVDVETLRSRWYIGPRHPSKKPEKRMTLHATPATSPAVAADQDRLLTVAEALKKLNVGRGTAYKLMASGDLPSITIGRSRRIRLSAVVALMAGTAA
jgi:excisionase family DNA binding protein